MTVLPTMLYVTPWTLVHFSLKHTIILINHFVHFNTVLTQY